MSHIVSIMNRFFRQRKHPYHRTAALLYQQKLIEEHYSFLRCRIENNVLVCRGTVTGDSYKNQYQVEVRCVYGHEPSTKIVTPEDIQPSRYIHMYDDHTLCLHYPPDMKWTGRTAIFQYTIPWLLEWILYYEIYLRNGNIWEGPESPTHITEADKNVTEDIIDHN